VEFLKATGCRVGELVQLKVENVTLRSGEATVRGKGDKERLVYLSPAAVSALTAYWKARKDRAPRSPAFARHDDRAGKGRRGLKHLTTQTIRDVLKRLTAGTGIHLTPHQFRHGFATTLLEETDSIAIVQKALGHVDPKTTMGYANVADTTVKRAVQEAQKR